MLQGTVKNLTRIFAPRTIGRLLFIGTALHFSLFADYVAPSGLAPGSSYMVLFVTSQTTDATNTDLSYYNTFVNDSANNLGGDTGSELASLGATWTVFGGISTAVGYADYEADPGVPVYNVNGDLIAADFWDLFPSGDGTLDNPVDLTETGDTFSGSFAWTGVQSNGNPDPSSQALGGGSPSYGDPDSTTYTWIDNYAFDESNTAEGSLYGLSSVLTVSAAPEPSTIWPLLGGIAAIGWQVRRRRQARSGC